MPLSTERARSFADFARRLVRDAVAAVNAWPLVKKLLVAAAVVAFIAAALLVDAPDIARLRTWADTHGNWFIAAFWCAYVVLTLFPLPRTVWTIAAGLLFGPWLGLALASTALTVSAVIALVVVRRLLGDWMRPRLNHQAVRGITQRLKARGWLAVASLRIVGVVPFSLLNYVAALTPVPVGQFAIATFVGSLPTTAIGVLFGDTLAGRPDIRVLAAFAVLALVGIGGLVLDARLPLARRGEESQVQDVD